MIHYHDDALSKFKAGVYLLELETLLMGYY